jgi:biotin transporter BioY
LPPICYIALLLYAMHIYINITLLHIYIIIYIGPVPVNMQEGQ